MAIVEADVICSFDMEEGSGNIVDQSGNESNGTVDGATWTTGGPTNLGNGLSFDGTNDQVVLGNSSGYNITGDVSFEIWVSRDGFDANFRAIFGYDTYTTASTSRFFQCRIRDSSGSYSNQIDTNCRGEGGSGQTQNISTGEIGNATYHIVVTYDHSTGDVAYYIDGSSDALALDSANASGNINASSSTDGIYIGQNGFDAQYWIDKIFCFRMYNRILTSGEISTQYNSGNGLTYAQMFPSAAVNTDGEVALMGCNL